MLSYSGVFESGDTSQFENRIVNLEAKDSNLDSRITALEDGIGATILKDTESLSSNKNGKYNFLIGLTKDKTTYNKVVLKIPALIYYSSMGAVIQIDAQTLTILRNGSVSAVVLAQNTVSCLGNATGIGSAPSANNGAHSSTSTIKYEQSQLVINLGDPFANEILYYTITVEYY